MNRQPPTASREPEKAIVAKPNPLALRREAAAVAMGVSEETFDKHVRPTLDVVLLGTVRVYPVAAIERWLLEHSATPADQLRRAA